MKTLTKLSRNIVLSTALLATAANLVINYFVIGPIDFLSVLIYIGLGLTVAYIFGNERMNGLSYALLGVGVSLAYNLGGLFFSWFLVAPMFIVVAALQQGVIFYLIAKMEGVKG